jgi:Zn-dependent peptidase ImmA (M78 family)
VARLHPCSRNSLSPLVQRFTQRLGVGEGRADEAIIHLVIGLSKPSIQMRPEADLDGFLARRRIVEINVARELSSDGYIQPVGCTFRDGFRMVLKGGSPQTRSRFTIAHEICHTFFYEIVPELKFGSQEPDPEEERLCNLGAGELLMPEKSLRNRAKKLPMSVAALEGLARMYVVSPAAMLLRLRSIGLWNCEMSFWRPAQTGFLLNQLVGGWKAKWSWPDDGPLHRAWKSKQTISGSTYVELRGLGEELQLRSVFFQVARRGDSILALWSAKPFENEVRKLPLFDNEGCVRVAVT